MAVKYSLVQRGEKQRRRNGREIHRFDDSVEKDDAEQSEV
jgi:hypothetical protein